MKIKDLLTDKEVKIIDVDLSARFDWIEGNNSCDCNRACYFINDNNKDDYKEYPCNAGGLRQRFVLVDLPACWGIKEGYEKENDDTNNATAFNTKVPKMNEINQLQWEIMRYFKK